MAWQIQLDALEFFGRGLDRPECVVTTAEGRLFTSDKQFGVREIVSAEQSVPVGARTPDAFLANGFSLLADGSFLVANLGNDGGVWQIRRGLAPSPWLLEVDGLTLPPCNFVNAIDDSGRTNAWISVSTRHIPRETAFRLGTDDGFIVRADARGARIVADSIGFTNENKLHPNGEHLFVSETIRRRISRYPVLADGDLGARETVIEFDDGIWPDGFEFDANGALWIASVVSNRLIRLDTDGDLQTIVDDSAGNEANIALAEQRFAEGTFSRADIDAGANGVLANLASVSFGGADLKTVYLGSLFGSRLATFRSPVAGSRPRHFDYKTT